MNKKRWIAAVGTVTICMCLTVAIFVILSPQHSIVEADFDRIEIGMTMTTVESILGGPSIAGVSPVWAGDEDPDGVLFVIIDLDAQNRVLSKRKFRRQLSTFEKIELRCLPSSIF